MQEVRKELVNINGSIGMRHVNPDGSVGEGQDVFLPVCLGLPYNLAELLSRPVKTAILLHTHQLVGGTIRETWGVHGRYFEVDEDIRSSFAQLSRPIGAIKGACDQLIPVYQRKPTLLI